MRRIPPLALTLAVVVVAACGNTEPRTAWDVSEQIGCTESTPTDNFAGLDEIDCIIDGAEVTVTDWSGVPAPDRASILDWADEQGYYIIDAGGEVTVGTDDALVADVVRTRLG